MIYSEDIKECRETLKYGQGLPVNVIEQLLGTIETLWKVVEVSTAFKNARRIACMAPQMGRQGCYHCRWDDALRTLDEAE